jgi:hypothetical protein
MATSGFAALTPTTDGAALSGVREQRGRQTISRERIFSRTLGSCNGVAPIRCQAALAGSPRGDRGLHELGKLGLANPSTCYGAKVGQPWGRCLLSL